jgi:hypothetical protein
MKPQPALASLLCLLAPLASLEAKDLINDSFDWGPGTSRPGIQYGDLIDKVKASPDGAGVWQTKNLHFAGVAGPGNGRVLMKFPEDTRKDTGGSLRIQVDPGRQATATVKAKIRFNEAGTGVRGITVGWHAVSADVGFLVNQSTDNIHIALPASGKALLKSLLGGQASRVPFNPPVAFQEGDVYEFTLSVIPGRLTGRITAPDGSVSSAETEWKGSLPAIPVFAVDLTGCSRSPGAESAVESVRIESGEGGP